MIARSSHPGGLRIETKARPLEPIDAATATPKTLPAVLEYIYKSAVSPTPKRRAAIRLPAVEVPSTDARRYARRGFSGAGRTTPTTPTTPGTPLSATARRAWRTLVDTPRSLLRRRKSRRNGKEDETSSAAPVVDLCEATLPRVVDREDARFFAAYVAEPATPVEPLSPAAVFDGPVSSDIVAAPVDVEPLAEVATPGASLPVFTAEKVESSTAPTRPVARRAPGRPIFFRRHTVPVPNVEILPAGPAAPAPEASVIVQPRRFRELFRRRPTEPGRDAAVAAPVAPDSPIFRALKSWALSPRRGGAAKRYEEPAVEPAPTSDALSGPPPEALAAAAAAAAVRPDTRRSRRRGRERPPATGL